MKNSPVLTKSLIDLQQTTGINESLVTDIFALEIMIASFLELNVEVDEVKELQAALKVILANVRKAKLDKNSDDYEEELFNKETAVEHLTFLSRVISGIVLCLSNRLAKARKIFNTLQLSMGSGEEFVEDLDLDTLNSMPNAPMFGLNDSQEEILAVFKQLLDGYTEA